LACLALERKSRDLWICSEAAPLQLVACPLTDH
jgi:hypothetical protein